MATSIIKKKADTYDWFASNPDLNVSLITDVYSDDNMSQAALQAHNGSNGWRLLMGRTGSVDIWKTTDSGANWNIDSHLVRTNGTNELFYEEITTRNGAGTTFRPNPNFLTGGYLSILKVGKQVIVRVSGISSKTGQDWMGYFNVGYRPYWGRESFKYMLGGNEYTGWINGESTPGDQGYIFFSTLNQTDLLAATIIFNIA